MCAYHGEIPFRIAGQVRYFTLVGATFLCAFSLFVVVNRLYFLYRQHVNYIKVKAEKNRIDNELSLASDIQQNMLPDINIISNLREVDIFGFMNPAVFVYCCELYLRCYY